MTLKAQIEAILFLTDKPMRAQAIARIVNQDVQVVRQGILELIHDYEQRNGGLEIADDNGYIIQVKDQYASIIDEFVPMEMPIALVRTLSAIAIKQPVPQSEIIKIRGAGAYDHIKELIERELISKKEEGGRSPILSTTKKFQEYFRLSHDAKSLRTEIKKVEKKAAKAEDEQAAADITAAATTGQLQLSDISTEQVQDIAADQLQDISTEQLQEIFDASPDASFSYTSAEPDQDEPQSDPPVPDLTEAST